MENLGTAKKLERSTIFPVEEVHFALHLQYLVDTTKSKATVEEAVNATISLLVSLQSTPQPSCVLLVLHGLQRKLVKPKVKKEPTTAATMLTTLVEGLDTLASDPDRCFTVICCILMLR